MTQLFKNNEENRRLFEVVKNAKAQNISLDAVLMYNEILGSKALGEVIFDNGLVDFGFDIDRNFFVNNYLAILDAMTKPIVMETHRILIKSLLGESVEVTFEIPKPGHLIVNIVEQTSEFGLKSPNDIGLMAGVINATGKGWALRNGNGLEARSNAGFSLRGRVNVGIKLSSAITEYTIEQARNVLENLTTEGVFTEFNFSIGS